MLTTDRYFATRTSVALFYSALGTSDRGARSDRSASRSRSFASGSARSAAAGDRDAGASETGFQGLEGLNAAGDLDARNANRRAGGFTSGSARSRSGFASGFARSRSGFASGSARSGDVASGSAGSRSGARSAAGDAGLQSAKASLEVRGAAVGFSNGVASGSLERGERTNAGDADGLAGDRRAGRRADRSSFANRSGGGARSRNSAILGENAGRSEREDSDDSKKFTHGKVPIK